MVREENSRKKSGVTEAAGTAGTGRGKKPQNPTLQNAPLGTSALCFIATLLLGFSEQSLRENNLLVVNDNNLFFLP